MPPALRLAWLPPARNRRSARLSNAMMQAGSGDYRGHRTLMEYAELCMSMCLSNARYLASCR
jgi:hypothetical protein